MNDCDRDDNEERERRYRTARRPAFQRREFGRDYEIFEGILEMKNKFTRYSSITIKKF